MKLNNYQKILYSWAGLLLFGYLASLIVIDKQMAFFTMWFMIGLAGLGIQLKLGGLKNHKTKLIQLLWLFIVLGGIALNIFEYNGTIPVFGNNPFMGWPLAIAFGYLVVSIIYRFDKSYLLLMLMCLLLGLIVYFISTVYLGLIVSGVGFAIICSTDALIENSKLRK